MVIYGIFWGKWGLKMIIVIVLACLALLLAAALVWAFKKAYYSSTKRNEDPYAMPASENYAPYKERTDELIGQMEKIDWEEVTITSRDGLKLFGRYLHVADGAPVHIQMHGYRGTAYRDFCGGNHLARMAGHNTLLVDQRGIGKSGGTVISFGVNERYDLLCWIDYVNRRFGEKAPVFISGVSMGAATVLMATGLDLPANIAGVIADCPYSSPRAIISKVCGDMGLPAKIAYPFARLAARLLGKFDPDSASCIEAVKDAEVPILIIHGEADAFVPCEMSREIHAANPGMVRLETFPGAGHGLSYMVDTPRYEEVARDFMDFCLSIF